MSDYRLTANQSVIRAGDGACIPNDAANRDWVEYQKWLEDGGVPDPYVEPVPLPPTPTMQDELLFDHENRLRSIEGLPPLSVEDFRNMSNGL